MSTPEGDGAVPMPTEEKKQPEVPLIEIIVKAHIAVGMPLHHFKIFPDGKVEGFEKLGADVAVVNRVPMLLASLAGPLDQICQDVSGPINALFEVTQNLVGEVKRLSKDQQLMEPAPDPHRIAH